MSDNPTPEERLNELNDAIIRLTELGAEMSTAVAQFTDATLAVVRAACEVQTLLVAAMKSHVYRNPGRFETN